MNTYKTQTALPSTALSRLLFGFGSTATTQIIGAANAILLVPLFIRVWGVDGYGRWLSLTALISYLSLFDLGGQSFIGNLLATAYVRGNKEEFRRKLAEGVSLYSLISLVGIIILIGVLSLPGLSMPGKTIPFSLQERVILLSMGMNTFIAIPGAVYASGYRAIGKFARGTMMVNAARIVTFGMAIVVLLLGLSPMMYAIFYLVSGSICTVVIVWDMQHRVPLSRNIHLSLASARAGRILLSGSFQFWLISVANAINFQGVVIVLAAYMAPQEVALYVTTRTMSGLVGYIGSLLQGPLWAEMTILYAQRRIDDLTNITLLGVKTVLFLSGCIALGLWVIFPTVYPLWTGKQLHFQSILCAILLIQAVLAGGWSTAGWVLLASNQHRLISYWSVANAGLTITLSAILAPRWGIIGVAIGTLTGDMICGLVIYPYLSAKLLKLPTVRIYQALLQPMIAVLMIGAGLIGGSALVNGWRGQVLGGLLSMPLLYGALYLALGKKDLLWLLGQAKRLYKNP